MSSGYSGAQGVPKPAVEPAAPAVPPQLQVNDPNDPNLVQKLHDTARQARKVVTAPTAVEGATTPSTAEGDAVGSGPSGQALAGIRRRPEGSASSGGSLYTDAVRRAVHEGWPVRAYPVPTPSFAQASQSMIPKNVPRSLGVGSVQQIPTQSY